MLVYASITLGLVTTMGCVAALHLWHKNKQVRQMEPELSSLAPAIWLFSPRKAARIHRRVLAVLQMIHSCAVANSRRVPPNHEVAKLTRDMLQEAVVLDDQLVASGRMGRGVGRRLLNLIEPQVAHLEELAGRLAIMTGGSSRPGTASATALVAIDERLGTLEAAHHEIIHLETLLSTSADASPRAIAHGPSSSRPDPIVFDGRDHPGDHSSESQD